MLQRAKALSSTFPGVNPTIHATLSRRRSNHQLADLKHNFFLVSSLPLGPLGPSSLSVSFLPAHHDTRASAAGTCMEAQQWIFRGRLIARPRGIQGTPPCGRPSGPSSHCPSDAFQAFEHRFACWHHAQLCCPPDRDLSQASPHSNPMLDTCPTSADPSLRRRKGRLPIATLANLALLALAKPARFGKMRSSDLAPNGPCLPTNSDYSSKSFHALAG